MQALVSMGELLNPASNQKECNLEQARYIIDTIAMLNEKTKGNLNEDESKVVDNILYELRIKYVELNKRQNAT